MVRCAHVKWWRLSHSEDARSLSLLCLFAREADIGYAPNPVRVESQTVPGIVYHKKY